MSIWGVSSHVRHNRLHRMTNSYGARCQMHKVHANSVCTISVAAVDSPKSLFSSRISGSHNCTELDLYLNETEARQVKSK